MSEQRENNYDVVVVGGGQAGLSMGFYLRRSVLSYVILDAQEKVNNTPIASYQTYDEFHRLGRGVFAESTLRKRNNLSVGSAVSLRLRR